KIMKRVILIAVLFLGFALTVVLLSAPKSQAQGGGDESKIQQGFAIAPVHLNLQGKNRALVGLGSYLINAVGGCNDCHSCPSYTPGHRPYTGGEGKIKAANSLAGGVDFGPVEPNAPDIIPRNLTPDASGKPAGLTFEQFQHVLRTGEDPEEPSTVLQI